MSLQMLSSDDDMNNENMFKSSEDIREEYSTSNLVEKIYGIRKKFLSNEQNKILNLIVDGYSYKDIASLLGMPLKTIDNKVYCLRKEIKKRLFENKII